ncbi:hypothetical protein G647_07250 [Cladophialophora carrionii CBS 160.54]|uniref:Uncharacterized protein n=1 Tax=Cladophialophora carrionii CBS 160.54 TaxID=1279043 RepID=V9D4K5_9EURO|nr:uncharacterized protein G647_07250 [Cladophialophora carrionii CBS 160.54]ETI20907.1 hypothetical protein G647_07250 [Cladophialophora carrionii CBS 160.54]
MAPCLVYLSASPLKLRRLLWPFPWYFEPPPRPAVAELERDGANFQGLQQQGIRQLRQMPLFRMCDTWLCSLSRRYAGICCGDLIQMSYECEYFFFHGESSWRLCRVRDPKDPDPVTYAVLASMVEALVEAFNWRLELGLRRDKSIDSSENRSTSFEREEAPTWTAAVKALPETLYLDKVETGSLDSSFLKRDIRAPKGYLYTV